MLGDTQVCAIGFGDEAALNADRLTLLAERQGGIHIQNPSFDPADEGTFRDIKAAFAKCLGVTNTLIEALDPEGTMRSVEFASDPVTTSLCEEDQATFVAGWKESDNNTRLHVTTPSGALVTLSSSSTTRASRWRGATRGCRSAFPYPSTASTAANGALRLFKTIDRGRSRSLGTRGAPR
jgi:hypothetical protein